MFTVTVYFNNGAIKEYSREDFVETYKNDNTKYADDALDGIEEPMTGKEWAELIGSSDADVFDNVVLVEAD